MNEATLPGAVGGAPVKITARRLSSLPSCWQVLISESKTGVLTVFSLSGLDTIIVATL
jgi:hypothetical protein